MADATDNPFGLGTAPTGAPAVSTSAAATTGVPGDRGDGGIVDGVVLALVVLLTCASVGFVLARAEHRALHDPDERAARGEVFGATGDSLAVPANLAKGLAKAAGRSPAGT